MKKELNDYFFKKEFAFVFVQFYFKNFKNIWIRFCGLPGASIGLDSSDYPKSMINRCERQLNLKKK